MLAHLKMTIIRYAYGLTHSLTHWQTLKDRATQLLVKYKSGALVTQWSVAMGVDTKKSFHCCSIQFWFLKSTLWLGFHPCSFLFQEIKHSIKRSHVVRDLFFLWWKNLSTSWWWYFGGEVEVCANAEQGLIRWSHNRARCQGGPDYHLLLLNIKERVVK